MNYRGYVALKENCYDDCE